MLLVAYIKSELTNQRTFTRFLLGERSSCNSFYFKKNNSYHLFSFMARRCSFYFLAHGLAGLIFFSRAHIRSCHSLFSCTLLILTELPSITCRNKLSVLNYTTLHFSFFHCDNSILFRFSSAFFSFQKLIIREHEKKVLKRVGGAK
jgi:hypothetical protein